MTNNPSRSSTSCTRCDGIDHLFKMVIIGDAGVGKSCLLNRFAENRFGDNYPCGIGIEFKIKKVMIDGATIKLQLWDTAGQERYRCLTAAYFRGSYGIILTYDITNRKSFDHLDNWFDHVQKYCPDGHSILLLGNKCDIDYKRDVDYSEAKEFAKLRGMTYMETSAKSGVNVEEAFITLVVSVMKKEPPRFKCYHNNHRETESRPPAKCMCY